MASFRSSSLDASAEFTAMSSTERKLTLEAQLLSEQLATTRIAIKVCNKEASRSVSATRRNQKRARAILLLQDGRPDALQAFCNTLPDTGRAEQKDALQFFESTSLPDLMITLQEVQSLPDMDYLFARQFMEEWALGRWIQTMNEEHGIVPSSATIKHKMLEDKLEGETNKVIGSKKELEDVGLAFPEQTSISVGKTCCTFRRYSRTSSRQGQDSETTKCGSKYVKRGTLLGPGIWASNSFLVIEWQQKRGPDSAPQKRAMFSYFVATLRCPH